jgi:hypothetical protein
MFEALPAVSVLPMVGGVAVALGQVSLRGVSLEGSAISGAGLLFFRLTVPT